MSTTEPTNPFVQQPDAIQQYLDRREKTQTISKPGEGLTIGDVIGVEFVSDQGNGYQLVTTTGGRQFLALEIKQPSL